MRMISLDVQNTTRIIQNSDLVQGTDYNFHANTIFWFSSSDKTVYTAGMNTDSEKQSITRDSSSVFEGLAVDWIHQHLYWVDEGRKEICLSNFNSTMKKVLFNDD